MRSLDESRNPHVIRTLDVLMGSSRSKVAHSISQGGYGIISKDFEGLMRISKVAH